MSTTRYKIRLWEYDGEASVANAVTFDSFEEAEARFNDLRVSEEMPCVEFVKERIANGCIIGDEVLNVRQFTSVFDAITKDKPTLAGFLRSLPVIEAPWDAAFHNSSILTFNTIIRPPCAKIKNKAEYSHTLCK